MKKILVLLVLAVFFGDLHAKIVLPPIISNHMVLKQKSLVPLWGWEKAGQKVQVQTSWDNKIYTTVAAADGSWKVMVQTPQGGGPYVITFTGEDKVKFNDVLIGEVWISSGQSNMAFRMRQDVQADKYLPNSSNSQIRLFKPGRKVAQTEVSGLNARETEWELSEPKNVKEFSAMTWYFANDLQKKLNVPVGIINASWGGVGIETWIPSSFFANDIALQQSTVRWKKWQENVSADSIKFVKDSLDYKKKITRTKPELPQSMYMMRRPHRQPNVLYNGMIAPCAPYALSGMLWYQGTSNVEWANEYEHQLNALIKSWRTNFNQPDMPVIIGQLTTFKYKSEENAYTLRMAQFNQQKLKNVYVFSTMDAGELKEIHPTNKQPYGNRFAAMALDKVYQIKGVSAMSPTVNKATANGAQVTITFDYASGLHAINGNLDELYLAGDDKKFVKADCQVVNNTIVASSKEVAKPKYARYLYFNTANVQLFNGDQLPAFPFSIQIQQQ